MLVKWNLVVQGTVFKAVLCNMEYLRAAGFNNLFSSGRDGPVGRGFAALAFGLGLDPQSLM